MLHFMHTYNTYMYSTCIFNTTRYYTIQGKDRLPLTLDIYILTIAINQPANIPPINTENDI